MTGKYFQRKNLLDLMFDVTGVWDETYMLRPRELNEILYLYLWAAREAHGNPRLVIVYCTEQYIEKANIELNKVEGQYGDDIFSFYKHIDELGELHNCSSHYERKMFLLECIHYSAFEAYQQLGWSTEALGTGYKYCLECGLVLDRPIHAPVFSPNKKMSAQLCVRYNNNITRFYLIIHEDRAPEPIRMEIFSCRELHEMAIKQYNKPVKWKSNDWIIVPGYATTLYVPINKGEIYIDDIYRWRVRQKDNVAVVPFTSFDYLRSGQEDYSWVRLQTIEEFMFGDQSKCHGKKAPTVKLLEESSLPTKEQKQEQFTSLIARYKIDPQT